MADTRRRPVAARALALVAGGGIILAVLLAALGHLDADPAYDPLKLTISDYALSDRSGAVVVAMVTLGLASLALLAGLYAVRAPVRPLPTVLLLVWVGGLMMSAAVPTDPLGAPMSLAGLVHRYASVSSFVALPVAAVMLSRRLHGDIRWAAISGILRTLAAVCAVGLALMLYVAFPGERVLLGLVERLLVIVEVAILGVLVIRLRRIAGEPARSLARR